MELREIRFHRKLSQWDLAKIANVHQSRISLIENGHPANDYEKQALSKSLHIRPEEIAWPETNTNAQGI
ncbi:MAG: helix-turn-helix transcriptional regulator [Desulfobacterales bacterium]|nr:MAG: helix-turn-helix transcriptional regulator [Desulfobacterales bacterium]